MALLRPKSERRNRGFVVERMPTCPLNGHQVSWCRMLCQPVDGHGQCGRLAPHAMIGRTQAAIMAFKDATAS